MAATRLEISTGAGGKSGVKNRRSLCGNYEPGGQGATVQGTACEVESDPAPRGEGADERDIGALAAGGSTAPLAGDLFGAGHDNRESAASESRI